MRVFLTPDASLRSKIRTQRNAAREKNLRILVQDAGRGIFQGVYFRSKFARRVFLQQKKSARSIGRHLGDRACEKSAKVLCSQILAISVQGVFCRFLCDRRELAEHDPDGPCTNSRVIHVGPPPPLPPPVP